MNINYYETFIQVAPDCPIETAIKPEPRAGKKTLAVIEHELLSQPYVYTQEEVLFETHARHKEIPASELKANRRQLWEEFFAKPRACLRSSALPKRYGWGIHFDAEGKAAIYPVESEEYRRLAQDKRVKQLLAMRSKRG